MIFLIVSLIFHPTKHAGIELNIGLRLGGTSASEEISKYRVVTEQLEKELRDVLAKMKSDK